jgi:hypothetical protein
MSSASVRRSYPLLRMGITSFPIRGFDPLNDASGYGRELSPRLRPEP